MLELRRYEDSDSASVWRLHDEGLRQMGGGLWDDDLRSVRESYLLNGGEFLVGTADGEVIAMGAVRRVSDTVAEIERMVVDARFQRRGFGRKLLQALEARAGELGYRVLRLDTTTKQLPAQRLYEWSGYHEVGRQVDPAGRETILFEKQLGPSGDADLRASGGFGDPETYERGRPPFPADAVETVVHGLGLTPASTVLDLAAGTGKLARVLAPLVGRVIAVDPSMPMLSALRAQLPTVDARVGVAEAIPLADAAVDAVFVAEAFHWFRTAEASREIARVLTPDGHFVLLSQNQQWWERAELPWVPEFDALMEPLWEASVQLAGQHPNVSKEWKPALAQLGLFETLPSTVVEFTHRIAGEDFVAMVASWAWVAILPDEQRRAALERVRDLVGDDQPVALLYRTEIQPMRRR